VQVRKCEKEVMALESRIGEYLKSEGVGGKEGRKSSLSAKNTM